VIGYTDGTPVRALASNRYSDNLELSALRAVSAVRFLTSLGISRDKMRVGGDGEWKIPSPDNTTLPTEATAAAKAFSRRVVLLIETEESSK
jgi:flagellar motor protein MotB